MFLYIFPVCLSKVKYIIDRYCKLIEAFLDFGHIVGLFGNMIGIVWDLMNCITINFKA